MKFLHEPKRPLLQPATLLLIAAMLGALAHAWYFNHTCDDAYISFRYAQNLARGQGLVFNPGERVMGYSDLTWVLLLGLFEFCRVPAPVAARVLGTLFAWGTLLLVHGHLRREGAHLLTSAAVLAMLAANGVFALWMFGGLEGHLFTFLVTGAVILALELPAAERVALWAGAGLALGLASLTRPEGIIFALPVALFPIFRAGRKGLRAAAAVAAAALALFLAGALWQYAYYGSPVPNTYYAKFLPLSLAVLRRGLSLSGRYALAYFGLPLLIPGGWLLLRKGARDRRGWLPLAVCGLFFAYYLRIGGDALVYYRMWLLTLPCMGLLAAEILERLRGLGRGGPALAAAAALLLAGLNLPASLAGRDIDYLRRDDAHLRDIALAADVLKKLPAGTVIAANVVGILTYRSGLRMVDMLGLNDAHIARAPGKKLGIPGHESHDGAYVLARRPQIIIGRFPRLYDYHPDWSLLSAGGYPSDRDLFADPEFAQRYELRYPQIDAGRVLPVFVSKTALARLGW